MKTLIVISFIVAFLLMVVPLPGDLRWFRPEFTLILIAYWVIYGPQYFGLFCAWVVGLFQDLIELAPLGLNAIGMLLVAYILLLLQQRLRNYVFWHQALWVVVLVALFQVFSHWIGGFMGRSSISPVFIISALVSGFLWPLVLVLMGRLQLHFRLLHSP